MATSRDADERDDAGTNGWRKSGPGGYNRGEVGIDGRGVRSARFRARFGECTTICTARAIRSRVFRELCGGSAPVLSAWVRRNHRQRAILCRRLQFSVAGCAARSADAVDAEGRTAAPARNAARRGGCGTARATPMALRDSRRERLPPSRRAQGSAGTLPPQDRARLSTCGGDANRAFPCRIICNCGARQAAVLAGGSTGPD
jgi:hypothetical protein